MKCHGTVEEIVSYIESIFWCPVFFGGRHYKIGKHLVVKIIDKLKNGRLRLEVSLRKEGKVNTEIYVQNNYPNSFSFEELSDRIELLYPGASHLAEQLLIELLSTSSVVCIQKWCKHSSKKLPHCFSSYTTTELQLVSWQWSLPIEVHTLVKVLFCNLIDDTGYYVSFDRGICLSSSFGFTSCKIAEKSK